MRETHLCTALRREILFIAACAAAAVLCVGLAFWFAVPQQPSQKQLPPDSTPLSEHWYVDLNTADAAALFGRAGINDLALFVSAIGTFHRAEPLFSS